MMHFTYTLQFLFRCSTPHKYISTSVWLAKQLGLVHLCHSSAIWDRGSGALCSVQSISMSFLRHEQLSSLVWLDFFGLLVGESIKSIIENIFGKAALEQTGESHNMQEMKREEESTPTHCQKTFSVETLSINKDTCLTRVAVIIDFDRTIVVRGEIKV